MIVSPDDVPSPEEAEKMANPPAAATNTGGVEQDGPNSDVRLLQNYMYVIILIMVVFQNGTYIRARSKSH